MSGPGKPIRAAAGMDRRDLMRWAGAVAAALATDGYFGRGQALADPPQAVGYGLDPDLVDPKTPWPRTLTASQLRAAKALCDFILPAEGAAPSASAIGVHELLDEWVSAPYPNQRADRALILPGLAWMDAQARQGGARDFATAPAATQQAVLAKLEKVGAPEGFYAKVRVLVIGAYFTTEEGFKDIGYIGNTPLSAYPPPSPEVMNHLDRASRALKLPLDGRPARAVAS